MSKKNIIIETALSVIFAGAVFFFLGFKYTYHIHYQEQFQLFEFTWAYFLDVVRVPGGFADWCGRFIVQFGYYARTGAFLITLLLVAVQLLTYLNINGRCLTSYAISFLPAVLLFAFVLDENAIIGTLWSVILSLVASYGVKRIESRKVRTAVMLSGIPVVYMLCGPLALIYVFAVLRSEKFWVWAVALTIAALCPFVSQYVFAYPLERLMKGIHYHRYPHISPPLLWISGAVTAMLCIISAPKKIKRAFDIIAGLIEYAMAAAVGVVLTLILSDFEKESIMKYDFMKHYQMWNRTMMEADVKSPKQPVSVSCLNLALAMTGRMEEHMFEYYQNGPQGLLPEFNRESTVAMSTADIYYQLGMVNTAQRLCFEAQESIPDFQKSARCYQMLVKTNIVNFDYEVARKYISALKHTLFYSTWAKDAEAMLYDEDAINKYPEFKVIRLCRFKKRDFLFSDKEMDSMLGLLFMENEANRGALDYMLAWTLLNKDLDRFEQCLSMYPNRTLPKPYQEALLLNMSARGELDQLPGFIDESVAKQFYTFITDQKKGRSERAMEWEYGKTYWFYYMYRFN